MVTIYAWLEIRATYLDEDLHPEIDEKKVERGEFDILSLNLVKYELLRYENIFKRLKVLVNPFKVIVIILSAIAFLFSLV